MYIADMIIDTYAMESALLRSRKLAGQGKQTGAGDLTAVLLRDALGRIAIAARNVLAAAPSPGAMDLLRRLASYEPVDTIELRRLAAAGLRNPRGRPPDAGCAQGHAVHR